ncbi:MAG: hypothetical protein KC910_00420 [Candidatus Eremiobacteraeota bacterium]|nr:hypothetical protein [Candidatus Eremiobacteraeota bacterium]
MDTAQLHAWQAAEDTFKTQEVPGLKPTGSPAQRAYTEWLGSRLREMGAQVSTEPYSFEKWTPTRWSLTTAAGQVPLANYIPWSGQTGPEGIAADLVHAQAHLSDLAGWVQEFDFSQLATNDGIRGAINGLSQRLSDAFDPDQVRGKTVVVDLPRLGLPYSLMSALTYYSNDPDGSAFGAGSTTGQDGSLVNMVLIPALQKTLAGLGAKAMVGVLDLPEPLARGAYYPFFGYQAANLPGVFLDREEGAKLEAAIAANGGNLAGTLTVEADLAQATDQNLVAVVDAPGKPEIVVSSHTDGTNSLEDNGPVAMLAMAKYFAAMPEAERPAKLRFVFTGGHFVGSAGIRDYLKHHASDLSGVRAILEVEHLGAREWGELPSGKVGLTGRPEPQILLTNLDHVPIAGSDSASAAQLRQRATEYAEKFTRSLVLGPFPVGEGLWWHYPPLAGVFKTPLPSIQLISNPSYLLSSGKPVTDQFTDYDLMRRQTIALTQMAVDLAKPSL